MPIVRLYNACWAWVVREFELWEVSLVAAIAAITYGCWLAWHPAAFVVPGAIVLWMVMPTRQRFIERVTDDRPATELRAS